MGDRHLNIVLGDCEEFRKLACKEDEKERQERRVLGLTILRGEDVESLVVEGPPPTDSVRIKSQSAPLGPGTGRAAGRGIFITPAMQNHTGPIGPVEGFSGSSPASMQPYFHASTHTHAYPS